MKKRKDHKLNIHIVHSCKGGSGKTAFSLMKAIDISIQNAKQGKCGTLYLDADFKGTSVKKLLYGESESVYLQMANKIFLDDCTDENNLGENLGDIKLVFQNSYNALTINDFLTDPHRNISEIIVKSGVVKTTHPDQDEFSETGGENTGRKVLSYLDFIFSSPDAEKKELFYYGVEEGELPALSAYVFKGRIHNLLEQIIGYKKTSCSGDNLYYDVIIDMPPGEDEYSKILIQEISKFNEEIEVIYYAMTTVDLGHMYTEGQELFFQMRKRSKNPSYKKYCIVFNETNENELEKYLQVKTDQDLRECIRNMIPIDKNISNLNLLFYTKNKFNECYYSFCRKNDQDYIDINTWKEYNFLDAETK